MKKLLIASTALVATAGMAAADYTITGDAAAGFYTDGTDEGVYSSVGVDIAFTGETDNGLTFGATLNIDAGTEYDRGDFELDGVDGGTAGLGGVWIAGGFGKVTFDADDIDDLYDDDFSHDVGYAGDFNGVSVGLTYDVDGDNADSSYSISLGYTTGSLTLGATHSDLLGGSTAIDAAYAINDMITVGLNHDMPGVGDAVTEGRVAFTSNGISVDISADTADNWDVGLGYSVDTLSVGISTDEASAWEATVSYGLGGGASLEAGFNHADAAYAGMAFTF
jgi:outer membrane protein OmpU